MRGRMKWNRLFKLNTAAKIKITPTAIPIPLCCQIAAHNATTPMIPSAHRKMAVFFWAQRKKGTTGTTMTKTFGDRGIAMSW